MATHSKRTELMAVIFGLLVFILSVLLLISTKQPTITADQPGQKTPAPFLQLPVE